MGSIHGKAYPLPQKHMVTVSTPAGRSNVTHRFYPQESSPTATTHIAKVSIPVGRWKKGLDKGGKVSTPCSQC